MVLVWIIDRIPRTHEEHPRTGHAADAAPFPTLRGARVGAGIGHLDGHCESTTWVVGILSAAAATFAATIGVWQRPRVARAHRLGEAVRMSFLEPSCTRCCASLSARRRRVHRYHRHDPHTRTADTAAPGQRAALGRRGDGPHRGRVPRRTKGLLVGHCPPRPTGVCAGQVPPGAVLLGRLAVIATGPLLACAVAVALVVTAVGFSPRVARYRSGPNQ